MYITVVLSGDIGRSFNFILCMIYILQSIVDSVDNTNFAEIGQWVAIFCEDAEDLCFGKMKEL